MRGAEPRICLAALLVASFALRATLGSVGLDSTRNFDERFTLHNVRALLEGRPPANAYYPGLSYLPQTAVLAASQALYRLTGWERLAVFRGEAFSPTAYLLCRWLAALYGTLAIALVYRVGKRLACLGEAEPASHAAWAGLAGAALLAALPAHVSASAQVKPDVLVVLLALLAFDWSLSAALEPTRRGFLRAGAGVGLAVAAKYTGVGAALPLAVGALVRKPVEESSRSRLLRWLGLAALASIITFLLLNPFLPVVLRYLPELAEIYQRKGAEAGGSHLGVLGAELRFLLRHHGWLLTGVALASLAWLSARAWRAERREERVGASMVLAWPLGYSLLYAAATTLFKGQNYLPVAAFTSIAAGLGIAAAGKWVAVRWPRRRMRPAFAGWSLAALGLFGAVLLFRAPVAEVYREVVPSTYDRAAALLVGRLQPLALSHVVFERRDEPLRVTAGGTRAAMQVVTHLGAEPPEALDLADAEVFLGERLESPRAELYRQRLAAAGAGAQRLEAQPFAAHGPSLAVLLHR